MTPEPRTIAIEITVPDPAWTVKIREVHTTDEKLLVVSSLSRDPEVMAAQVISRATDSIRIPAPDLPVEHLVLGRTFAWAEESYQFVQDKAELEKKLMGAKRIYPEAK